VRKNSVREAELSEFMASKVGKDLEEDFGGKVGEEHFG
jgi:hypothetical protein